MSGLFGGKRTQINNTETAIGAVQVQNSAQGLPIPIVYGTTRITGNNIWYGDFTAVPHTETQSSGGGKGGGGGVTSTNTTYTYTTGVAIGLCEGPITGVGQIWEQKNVTTAAALGLTEFTGSYAQAPWSYLTSSHPSEALGYRGIGYVATAAYQLGNSSSLPNLSFEVIANIGVDPNWSAMQKVMPSASQWYNVVWNGSVFCAIGAGGGVATSPDGSTWTAQTINSADYGGAPSWYSLGTLGSMIIAMGYNGGFQFCCSISTDNGITWRIPTNGLPPWPAANGGYWGSVAYNGAVFCAGGNAGPYAVGVDVIVTPDGDNWTEHVGALPGSTNSIWKIGAARSGAYAGRFVAVNINLGWGIGDTATSTDGVTWVHHVGAMPSSAGAWSTPKHNGSLFCSVMKNSALSATSADGITWTVGALPVSSEWVAVDWNGDVWVAVSSVASGSVNVAAVSQDGLNWTQKALIGSVAWSALASDTASNISAVVAGGGATVADKVTASIGTDVNPAFVLSALLLNANYGAGFPSAQLGSPAAFSSYCDAAGIAISPAYTAQRSAMDIATELCQIGNSAPFWSEGMLKVTPYADAAVGAFTPDTTVQYQLTDDDFLGDPPVKVLRKRPADAYNSLVVQCKDRSNNYNNATPSADDQANIDRYGSRPMPMITFDAICVPAVGRIVAQNILARELYYPNTYEFTVGWKYARLEPMDLVGLTDADVGLNQTTVRILTIEEDDNGELRMTAEDFNPGVSNSATYGTQASSGYIVNQAVAPGDANAPVIFQPSLALSGTPEVWLGTSGGADWGGAEVWLSSDNTTYTKFGTVTAPARHGVLTATLAAGADPDSVNTLAVDLTVSAGALITVPLAQADALITRCYVDGEVIAYETATLTSAYHYDLTYLRRGQYWSESAAHSAGAKFMRLDDAVFKTACPESWVGSTIYVKLLSFNKAGGGLQSLADVTPTTYAVHPVQVSTQNGLVYNTVTANEDLYIPANTVYTVSGCLTNHGRITCKGRLRITN